MRNQSWKREDHILSGKCLFYSLEKFSFSCLSYIFSFVHSKNFFYFRETQKKVDLKWHPNGTVTYKRVKYWYFERDLSVGDLTDVITTINVPVVGSAEFVRGSFFMEWGISDMLSTLEATIFIKKSIGELLFDGYEDTVMEIGSSMNGEYNGEYDYNSHGDYSDYGDDGDYDMDLGDVGDWRRRKREIEDEQKMDKFGWFYNVSIYIFFLNNATVQW